MTKPFIHDDFLLSNEMARRLYHGHAARMPIVDYHNHLPPGEIAEDRVFGNLTRIWLDGDHYKWRAMRAAGVDERFCTGDAGEAERFHAWAGTVPQTLRNPLYHWTHLELARWFGITELLGPDTAEGVYRRANECLATPEYGARRLLQRAGVTHLCTTDDPADSLDHHQALRALEAAPRVLPGFRPDRAMAAEDPGSYNAYLDRLGASADIQIDRYRDLLEALQRRHEHFAAMGCRTSDHGLERPWAESFTASEVEAIFARVRAGRTLATEELARLRSALLLELARMNHAAGWVQQFHIGPLRNVRGRLFRSHGPDAGADTIGDAPMAGSLARFIDSLDRDDRLARTILYNINPSDNHMFAAMVGSFQDGSVPGKLQYGTAWWFLDQRRGILAQLDALSDLGLLSRFVGMVTDSRSFLSCSRHEYFRRVLCDLLGRDVEAGELPRDEALLGEMVRDICYRNAMDYFGFDDQGG